MRSELARHVGYALNLCVLKVEAFFCEFESPTHNLHSEFYTKVQVGLLKCLGSPSMSPSLCLTINFDKYNCVHFYKQ